ncbi:MAG: S-layer homology domain-containing protein [Clostridia bacterium]
MRKVLSILMAVIIILTLSSVIVVFGYDGNVLYSDVNSNHWAFEAISFATEKKWFNGYSDGTFCPNNTISRAEATKVLVSLLERDVKKISDTSYSDVFVTDWYAPYIEAGKDLFLNVKDGGKFKPNTPISREETVYALVRGMKFNISVEYVDQSMLEKFTDAKEIDDSIKPYFTIAMQKKLISGYSDGTVKAKDSLTRAEFATLLYRAYRISQGKGIDQIEMTNDEAKSYEESYEDYELTDSSEIAFRKAVVTLVNEIRNDYGLNQLSENPDLAKVAQMKAEDMQNNDYFDHQSPTYGSPFDMMDEFGISYISAGENIAKGQSTPQEVVDSWMNSMGHRENILDPSYDQIGIGYSADEDIWVQMFIGQ